jgi:hypothetical protein
MDAPSYFIALDLALRSEMGAPHAPSEERARLGAWLTAQ